MTILRPLLVLILAVPLFGQLPPGVSRVSYSQSASDRFFFAATPNDVLWAAALLDDELARVEPGGGVQGLKMPPRWSGTRGMTAGPDGALWMGGVEWIARIDPVTNALQRWPLGNFNSVGLILSGPDGNIWFTQYDSVLRIRTDGTIISSTYINDVPRGAAFGTDGALYLTAPNKLIRITADGARKTFPASPRNGLFSGNNLLWSGDRSFDSPNRPPVGVIMKLSYSGETLATYQLAMEPQASDALGNLWLRATTAEGDIVGYLTPAGVLTRFGPLPAIPSNQCHQRHYGGVAFLTDGRIAMSDYYPEFPQTTISPCFRVPRPAEFRNTVTILDPRIAPVLSVQSLVPPAKKRSARH